ncbi:MAG TPA: cellulose binding domain-containing protein [Polyangia bacterium]|nr:cellulose binding domain-containing protein [Polyangia bacterium]
MADGASRLPVWTLVAALSCAALACGADPYHRTSSATMPDGGGGHPFGGTPMGNGDPFGTGGDTATGGVTGAGGATTTGGVTGAGGTTTATGGVTGTGGATNAGTGGAVATPPCPGCKVVVQYTCLSDAPDQATFVLEILNQGQQVFLTQDLTVRYWYTDDPTKPQELDCDDARLGCPNIKSKFVVVNRAKANVFAELSFPPGAVDTMGTTGRIQLRLRNMDYTQIDQTDDYSQDCADRSAHANMKVTAYLKGTLVGGVEPP